MWCGYSTEGNGTYCALSHGHVPTGKLKVWTPQGKDQFVTDALALKDWSINSCAWSPCGRMLMCTHYGTATLLDAAEVLRQSAKPTEAASEDKA